ncbi:TonB-dependent receptor [Pseudoduganella danionis]|uniref:TonB-dependent receptor n=1 Tax=Pseudoduganella danionis TaxID=1890295 RepID=A0ABW9STA4_9BURK|nr:TonB-dependent receptor [Pseudoduganella danionis]MTW35245.1 TonB-dependent receptor [Pseudoduganella danionis]
MRFSKQGTLVLRRSVAMMVAASAISGLAAGQAFAAAAASADAAAAAAADVAADPVAAAAANEPDKVIVTARRRAELIQDVPGSVTAISGTALEKSGIPDLIGLADALPNTTLKTSRATNTTLTAFIRGIGQQDPVAGYEQGVGIYLDDVYLARPQGALTDIYDLDRIEVLRGPQGTLYGRNTIGGAVKYVTRRLAKGNTLDMKGTIGSYNQRDLVVKASGELSDMLRVGGTVATFNRDGYGKNVLNGLDNYNKKVVAGRVSAELTPSASLFVRLSADRTVDDSLPKQGYRLTNGPAPANETPLSGPYDTRANLYTVLGHDQQVTTEGGSLLVDYAIDPTLSFKSITAYRSSKSYAPIDFDSLNTPLFEAPAIYTDRQASQEFQLTYTGSRWQGVAGVFYMKTNAFNEFDVLYNAAGGLSLYTRDDIDSKTWAAFADASYNVSDDFNINIGGRYTSDERQAAIYKRTYLGLKGSPTLGNPAAVGGAANTDLGKNDLNRTDTKFTPKLGLGWKIDRQNNMYASYSVGFKGGMFDPRMDLTASGGPNTAASLQKRQGVAPEEVNSYELGLKSNLNGGRLQTNVAVFYSDYKNVQIPGSIPTFAADGSVNGFAGTLTNAGKAKITGLELEAIARVTDQFTVSAMFSAIDAKYKEWMVANGKTLANVADQAEFQNTPKTSANLSATYDWPFAAFGRAGTLSLNNTVSYKSKVYQSEMVRMTGIASIDATVPQNLMLAQEGFGLWDAGLVWTSSDRKLQLALNGRNLLDKRYKVAGYAFGGFFNTVTTFYGDPRTVKASLSVKF